ncbi:MAG TPA: glutaredoxin domain-containing protein [Polyangiaceae bacterium]|nr:glutaredoxin domain-containing protein [Polyangiaceae bacterium]
MRAKALAFLVLLSATLQSACKAENDGSTNESSETAAASNVEAPELRDGTPGLLLVWVDDQGDFHTQGKVADVPPAQRAAVRVIFEKSSAPSPDRVWLADLTHPGANGRYTVKTELRAAWEKRGLEQRKARVEQARPAPAPAPADGATAASVDVTIYGADWCKPCHMAEAYLKKAGARVVKKDIEEDPSAAIEMRAKLQAAGLGGAGIPVIDVGGTLLVGFSESAIDAALRRVGSK